ncbi:hypothetical protein Efla_002242 [Eimeria flavescens]
MHATLSVRNCRERDRGCSRTAPRSVGALEETADDVAAAAAAQPAWAALCLPQPRLAVIRLRLHQQGRQQQLLQAVFAPDGCRRSKSLSWLGTCGSSPKSTTAKASQGLRHMQLDSASSGIRPPYDAALRTTKDSRCCTSSSCNTCSSSTACNSSRSKYSNHSTSHTPQRVQRQDYYTEEKQQHTMQRQHQP